jgi:hypothetical protein
LETKQATSDKTSDKGKRLIYAEDLFEPPVKPIMVIGGRSGGKTAAMYEQIFRKRVEMAPTVVAIPVSAEELRHLINDTLSYIWKMESDGRENLTYGRKILLEKLKRFEKEHFPDIACSCGERNPNG